MANGLSLPDEWTSMSPVLSRGQPRQSTTYHGTTTKRKHCDVLCQTSYRLVVPNLPGGVQKEIYKYVRETVIVYLGTSRISPFKGPRIRAGGVIDAPDRLNKTFYDVDVPRTSQYRLHC